MYPSQHLFFGAIFSLILFLFFPQVGVIEFSIILLSTVLIDVDHYLYYVFKKKNMSLKKAYKWFMETEEKFLAFSKEERNEIYTSFCYLHGIEILILLFFAIYISEYFLYAFIGIAFHFLLDVVNGTIYTDRLDKISVVNDFFKFKKLRHIETI